MQLKACERFFRVNNAENIHELCYYNLSPLHIIVYVVPLTVGIHRVQIIGMVVRQKRLIAAFCKDFTITSSI